MSGIDELVANAKRCAEQAVPGPPSAQPRKRIAIVACMDARIDVFSLLDLEEGDAHVIRNAGGVVTDDVIRSLAISQRLLGTEDVMLIHHTGCGMLSFNDDDFRRQIQQETGIKPPWAAEAFDDLEGDVRQSIARIRASPSIPNTQTVRGFIYDIASRRLTEVT